MYKYSPPFQPSSQTRYGEHLRLDLRNRFEALELDEDASSEDEWRELKDAAADTSQAHLGGTHRRRRDWALMKRLCWQSKRAWRGFNVRQITGS